MSKTPEQVSIAILVFDGVDELDVIGPLEVLRTAIRRGAKFGVVLAALHEPLTIAAAHGLLFHADMIFRPADYGLIIVPGGGWADSRGGIRTALEEGVLPHVIRKARAHGATIASVCTGAMALAAAGLADGRTMTTHHSARDDLRAYGAKVAESRIVDDGDIITAGGVTCGIDLALHLIERYTNDRGLAEAVARDIEYVGQPAVLAQ